MWKIIKNNAGSFILYLTAFFVTLIALRLFTGPELSPYFISFGAILLYIVMMGPVFTREQYEEKHKGYSIMIAFPLTLLEILAAKFLLVFCTQVLCTGSAILLLLTTQANPEELGLSVSFILFNGLAALILGGIMYIGIFGMGYTKFLVVILTATAAIGLAPFIILRFVGAERFMEDVIRFLLNANRAAVISLSLLLYIGSMFLAVALRRRRSP